MTFLGLTIGQRLQGRLSQYCISAKLYQGVWSALNRANALVIVKTAPQHRFQTEKELLKQYSGRQGFRQLVDEIDEQPPTPAFLVLKHLDDNVLNASRAKRLNRVDIKFISRKILEVLQVLHEDGYVHTDVKLDNIFINFHPEPNGDAYSTDKASVSEVELGDYGDICRVDPDDTSDYGHVIGAAVFRSPEAMLNLRWGPPTDIWSFGATVLSMIFQDYHLFKPSPKLKVDPEDAEYPIQVFLRQIQFFGPIPAKMKELADDQRLAIIKEVEDYIEVEEAKLAKPFSQVADPELKEGDKEFILKVMQLDPRDRPTAKELLGDKWFEQP